MKRHAPKRLRSPRAAIRQTPLRPDPGTPGRRMRRSLFAALVTGAAFFGVGTVWAVNTPLDKAVIVPGTVEDKGSRRSVAHAKGGVVEAVSVRLGQTVRKGDALLVLADVASRSREGELQERRDEIERDLARLHATRNDDITADLNADQRRMFDEERRTHRARTVALDARAAERRAAIAGYERTLVALEEQARTVRSERAELAPAVKRGFVPRNRLRDLDRETQKLRVSIAEARAAIAGARATIEELAADRATLNEERLRAVSAEIKALVNERRRLDERLTSARDERERTVLRAPADGTVSELHVRAPGVVLGAGEPAATISPLGETRLVRGRLSPDAVDEVRPGLNVKVRLLAFLPGEIDPITGTVTTVARDRSLDAETGRPFYSVEIAIRNAPPDVLVAGMPVEATVVTGRRTVSAYLMGPLVDGLSRSMTR